MLKNEYLVAKIGLDTAENEPSKVCGYQHTTPPESSMPRWRRNVRAATLRWILFITWRTFGGSFAAVWIATIASKVTFYSIFQALQDKQTFAPFTFQNFSEKTSKFLPEWKWNFIFHSRFSMNFAIFRRNFSENLPEFHRNCQETTKCTEILRKSVTKIRKMLEISGICEKISFFISFFHSCP